MKAELRGRFNVHLLSFILHPFFHYHFIRRRPPKDDVWVVRKRSFLGSLLTIYRFRPFDISFQGFCNITHLPAKPA